MENDKSMNLLIFNAYFEPENIASAYISRDIRSAILERGHTIHLFTPTPSRGLSKSVVREYRKRSRRRELLFDGGMTVRRYRMIAESHGASQRVARYLLCNIVQLYFGLVTRNVDAIFLASTPPTQGAVAGLISKIRKIPVVYSLQDIFPDSMISGGVIRQGGWIHKLCVRMEQFSYRNVSKIVVISSQARAALLARGVAEDKLLLIRNWPDEASVRQVPRDANYLFDEYALDRNRFYVSYCGNIGRTQNIELLLAAAKALPNKEIAFVIIGDGDMRQELVDRIQAEQLDNVKWIPFQPYRNISAVFSLGNAGLVISKPETGGSSVPSKTWNIMLAGIPVLASFDSSSELCDIVRSSGSGICCPPDDKDALVSAVLRLYADRRLCEEMGKNGQCYIAGHLTRQKGTAAYVQAIESAVSRRRTAAP